MDLRYLKGSLKDMVKAGMDKLLSNLKKYKITDGHLIVFNPQKDEFWEQKVSSTKIDKDFTIDVWKI